MKKAETIKTSGQRLKAITWAAAKEKVTYGQFVKNHNSDEIKDVCDLYNAHLSNIKRTRNR